MGNIIHLLVYLDRETQIPRTRSLGNSFGNGLRRNLKGRLWINTFYLLPHILSRAMSNTYSLPAYTNLMIMIAGQHIIGWPLWKLPGSLDSGPHIWFSMGMPHKEIHKWRLNHFPHEDEQVDDSKSRSFHIKAWSISTGKEVENYKYAY